MALRAIWRKLNAGAELHEERVQFHPKCDFFLNCMEMTFNWPVSLVVSASC